MVTRSVPSQSLRLRGTTPTGRLRTRGTTNLCVDRVISLFDFLLGPLPLRPHPGRRLSKGVHSVVYSLTPTGGSTDGDRKTEVQRGTGWD